MKKTTKPTTTFTIKQLVRVSDLQRVSGGDTAVGKNIRK